MKGKLLLLVVLAVTGGVVTGLVAAWFQSDASASGQGLEQVLFAGSQWRTSGSGTPRVRVEGATHDFGKQRMSPGGSHILRIHNEGDGLLEFLIRKIEGESHIQPVSGFLSPGESKTIIIRWPPPPQLGKITLRMELQTNDPRQPRIPLLITGEVQGMYHSEPETVYFQVHRGETPKQRVRILAFGSQHLTIHRLQLTNKGNKVEKAPFWYKLLPPDPVKLAPKGKDRGIPYQEIEIQLAPDLPPGRYEDQLEVFIKEQESPIVVVPLQAEVFGTFRVVGRSWDTLHRTFRLGSISQRQGRTFLLTVIGYGDEAAKARLELRQVVPKFLQVRIGSPEKIPNKDSWRWTLQVRVPENVPVGNFPANPSGSGSKIVLKTGHPEQPTLEIPLSFQVVP